MNERIDVLAEIDNAVERLRYSHYADDLRIARAAVAELIEAAQDDRDARDPDADASRLMELGGRYCNHDWPSIADLRKATDARLRTALARVGAA